MTCENKKILILGASRTQLPLLKAAEKLKVSTIVMSTPGDWPCFSIADDIVYENISNSNMVLQVAKEKKVDGIVTCGLDTGVEGIGLACETLGLHGPSASACLKARDKFLMKKYLSEAGVSTAPYFLIKDKNDIPDAINALSLPIVLKAVDQMGSRGIYKCETEEEIFNYLPEIMKTSSKPYCLAEKYLDGKLFGVEAMVQNEKIVYMMPNNTETAPGNIQKPIGHSVPFERTDLDSQIFEQIKKAVVALGYDNCPINCDCMLVDDKVFIIEITTRCGGNSLPELVSIRYDLNYYEVIIRLALGFDISSLFCFQNNDSAVLSSSVISKRSGVIARIIDYNPTSENILKKEIWVNPRDTVHAYSNGKDCIGNIIVKSDSLASCRQIIHSVKNRICIELENDIPLFETPIQKLKNNITGNRIWCKRDDLLPYSFGGNKSRFAAEYLRDMEEKNCNAMIIFGGYGSNLCRILALACKSKNIPCSMIYCPDDGLIKPESKNKKLIDVAEVQEYCCSKSEISSCVRQAMSDLKNKGFKPYYIHGDEYGNGNEITPMKGSAKLFYEIEKQEKEFNIHFDYIFLASSTNATQSGLICAEAEYLSANTNRVIGISVNRKRDRAEEAIEKNIKCWNSEQPVLSKIPQIIVDDSYLNGGYGNFSESLLKLCKEVYLDEGIPMDPVYVGKAYYGMIDYLLSNRITDKNILFIHTGGIPIFMDKLEEVLSSY